MEGPLGKVLEEEGFELCSLEVDRGAQSLIYRCRVARTPRLADRQHHFSPDLPLLHHHPLQQLHQLQHNPSGHLHSSASFYPIQALAEDFSFLENRSEGGASSSTGGASSSTGGATRSEDEGEEEEGLREGQVVRVKVLNVSLPLPRHLSNFQHEHQLVAESLRGVAGVVRILARLSRPGVEALVVEDFGGESLDKWLARDGPFAGDLGRFLALAVAVARTLGRIHSRSVVHKDIKPHNIIWNKETGEVKITDFGIASLVVRSKDTTHQGKLPLHLLGSLQYLPPELSLRSGDAAARPADHRSDFYSLGVTFFELLTGSVPFHERSAVRMMHAHMAKQAAAVHEVDGRVPRCVSAVVGRLLAKSVEERYQSSRGLVADLLRCERIVAARQRPSRSRRQQQQHEGQGSEAHGDDGDGEEEEEDEEWAEKAEREFKAGEDDVSDVFAFPAKLYGREDQISQLKELFTSAMPTPSSSKKQMRNQVVMVAGYSGVGKTALVGQLKEVKQQAYFISGKYDFNKRDVPYSAIVAAFTDMINQILSEDEESVSRVRERLREAVGSHGQMLVSVIPSLQLLIGEQPAVTLDLGMSEVQTLYTQLFTRLIDVFCSIQPGQPLVMFLDDLHWADQPSFQLLHKIVCRSPSSNAAPLLLLGGYRDNEVTSPTHPLWMFLDELRAKGVTCSSIMLQPLAPDDVNKMVADVLHYGHAPQEVLVLSTLVFEKTKGNPFFAISFLTKLYQTGLIQFDYDEGRWKWDLPRIQAMEYTDNVVEFMAQDLRNLPQKTLWLLEVAAFFGGRFDVRDIAQYRNMPVEEVEAILWPTLQQGFVGRDSDFGYHFLHDRVQQAAYECVTPKLCQKKMHLGVAQFLMTKIKVDEDIGQSVWSSKSLHESGGLSALAEPQQQHHRYGVFDVVYHFSKAAALIQDPAQRLLIAKLNLQAAIKAKNSMAYEMARKMAAQGIEMLPPDGWESQHTLAFQLHIERAQCEYLCKNMETAQQLFDELLVHARDVWETNEVYIQRNQMSTCMQRYDDMVASGLRGLAALGLVIPTDPSDDMVAQAVAEVYRLLDNRPIRDLLNDAPATDERAKGIQILISKMGSGYYFTNPNAYLYALVIGLKTSIEYGHVAHTSILYAWYGWVGCAIKKRFDEACEWGQLAIDLCNKHYANSRFADRGQVWEIFYSYINWLKHPLQDSIEGLETGFKHGVAGGNPAFATACAYNLMGTFWSVAPLHQIAPLIEPYKRYAEEANWGDVVKMMQTIDRHTRLLMDEPVEGTDDEFCAHIKSNARPMPIAQYHVLRMYYCYILGKYRQALEVGQYASKILTYIGQFKKEVEFYFMYSLVLLAVCKPTRGLVTPKERMRELSGSWRDEEKKRGNRAVRKRKARKTSLGSKVSPRRGAYKEGAEDPIPLTPAEYEHYLATVEENQKKLKQWADSAPCNFGHQYLLVEAERAWLAERNSTRGRSTERVPEIMVMFERAFAMAIENGFVQDAALAKELSWQMLHEMAGQAAAEAAYCYSRWGAPAVAKQREQQKNAIVETNQPTVEAMTPTTTEIISSALDLDTVVQATQHLSSKLKLTDLLVSLMDLIVANTGASKGVLLLTREAREDSSDSSNTPSSEDSDPDSSQKLYTQAKARISHSTGKVRVKVLQVPFAGDAPDLPNRILNYCWHAKSVVWLSDALQDDRFSLDEYIQSRRPKSVLCVPIEHKDKHRGLIYLENEANVGVFGEDRVRLVRILTGQLMNSMENALLVDRLRRTNREMRAKNNQLQEIDKVKDAFLAVASHELRTPLNGIIGMASLMDDTEMSEQQVECLTDIKASSETLLELVNDVLDLSKLKAMKVTLENKIFSLKGCFEGSMEMVEEKMAEKGINLAYVLEPDVPRFVKGDSLRLQQIVASLLVHCSKLTQSGEISVAVSLAAQPPSPSASSSPPGPDSPTPTSTATTPPAPSAATPSEAMPAQIPTRTSTEALATGTPIELLVQRAPLRMPQSAICPPALTQNILSASLSMEDDAIHDNDDAGPSPPPATTSSAETTPREYSPPPGPQVMLHFEVHSTGMTIDKEEYAQLFKPFGQSDLPNSRKFGAAGLGLYICRKLSKMFGGKIWADCSEGGSSIHFTAMLGLPTEEDDIEFERPSETKQLEGKHILLYVSNQTNANILRMHLTRAGAQVASATSREEFMECLNERELAEGSSGNGRFDCVVVDVPCLERVRVFLLSLTRMLPLTLLTTAVERKGKSICDFNEQYCPLHIMRLPLRQARMLEEFHDVLNSFAEEKSTTPFVRRERRSYAAGSVRRKAGGSQRIARGSPPPDPHHPA